MRTQKIILNIAFAVFFSHFSFSQDLEFSWSDVGHGSSLETSFQIDNNLFYTYQTGVGVLANILRYDENSDQLIGEPIKQMAKKQIATVGQARAFSPFVIGDKVYTFNDKSKATEVHLLERDRMTMEILGEPILLVDYANMGGHERQNVAILATEDVFALVDGPWYYPWIKEKKDQKKLNVFFFDIDSKKMKYNHAIELPADLNKIEILSRQIDDNGNVWILASSSTEVTEKTPKNTLSHELIVWKVNEAGVEIFREEADAQLFKASLMVSGSDVQIRSLILNRENKLAISIYSINGNELRETGSHSFEATELFEGNNRVNAQRFRNKVDAADKLQYTFSYIDYHTTEDGGGIEVIHMSLAVEGTGMEYSTLVYKYNKSGEIIWKKCIPAYEVVFSWVGVSGELNVLINDASERYDETGNFSDYSQEKVNAPQIPVRIVLDTDGEVVKRAAIANGFEKGEIFASEFGYAIDEKTILIGKKKDQGVIRVAGDPKPVVFGILKDND